MNGAACSGPARVSRRISARRGARRREAVCGGVEAMGIGTAPGAAQRSSTGSAVSEVGGTTIARSIGSAVSSDWAASVEAKPL